MSVINEMAPVTPQTHLSSGWTFGLINHTRLATTIKEGRNTLRPSGVVCCLVTGRAYFAEVRTWCRPKPLPLLSDEGLN